MLVVTTSVENMLERLKKSNELLELILKVHMYMCVELCTCT